MGAGRSESHCAFREKLDQPEKPLFDASEVNERVKKRVKKAVRSDEA